jgi:hypothetical protein
MRVGGRAWHTQPDSRHCRKSEVKAILLSGLVDNCYVCGIVAREVEFD